MHRADNVASLSFKRYPPEMRRFRAESAIVVKAG
jgi:hypothetical protein